jgi:hypothetical protein
MEKQFQLSSQESMTMAAIDQARTQALAAIGALSLDMEQARKQLDTAVERQRSFIHAAVGARGIDEFATARVVNNALVVSLPDPPSLSPSDVATELDALEQRKNAILRRVDEQDEKASAAAASNGK